LPQLENETFLLRNTNIRRSGPFPVILVKSSVETLESSSTKGLVNCLAHPFCEDVSRWGKSNGDEREREREEKLKG